MLVGAARGAEPEEVTATLCASWTVVQSTVTLSVRALARLGPSERCRPIMPIPLITDSPVAFPASICTTGCRSGELCSRDPFASGWGRTVSRGEVRCVAQPAHLSLVALAARGCGSAETMRTVIARLPGRCRHLRLSDRRLAVEHEKLITAS